MHQKNNFAFFSIYQFVLDFLSIAIAYLFSYLIAGRITQLAHISAYNWILVIFIPMSVLMMNTFQMYNSTTFYYYDRVFRNTLFSTFVSGAAVGSIMFFTQNTTFSRIFFASFMSVAFLMVFLNRIGTVFITRNMNLKSKQHVVVVGISDITGKFIHYISKTQLRFNLVGYVSVSGDDSVSGSIDYLGKIEDLEKILMKNVVDEVVFTLPRDYVGDVELYVKLCEKMGITVRMVFDLYDLKLSKTHFSSLGPLPMVTFHTVSLNKAQILVKRAIDILGAMVGIVLSVIPGLIVAGFIRLDSPGPIFFIQKRVGLNGRTFHLFKFRTMYIDAEKRKKKLMKYNQVQDGFMFKMENDPRITRVGKILRKTSLDELPQFINVLIGHMSLVGTRPPTVDEVKKYQPHHHRRISVKPGITGMWQVSGRSSITDFNEVVKLDTQYIDNWNIWLDMKIIIKTFTAVFAKNGAM